MKALKYTIITFLNVFVLLFFFTFRSSAESLVFSAETLQSLTTGCESLEYTGFVPFGVAPIEDVGSQKVDAIVNHFAGTNVSSNISNSDITEVLSFDQVDYELYEVISSWESVTTANGSFFDVQNSRLVSFDNGYYSGTALIDSNGNILYREIDGVSQPICNIRQVGKSFSTSDWASTYEHAFNAISENNLNYSLNGVQVGSDVTYYVCFGEWPFQYGKQITSVYISNQYQPGRIMPVSGGQNGQISEWYTNDPSLIHHEQIMGSISLLSVTPGSFSYGGYTYDYHVTFAKDRHLTGSTIGNMQDYINGVQGAADVFSLQGYTYNPNYVVSDVTSFVPVDDTLVGVGIAVGLGAISSFADSLADEGVAYNPSYTGTLPIDGVTNYPVIKTIEYTFDDVLPLPIQGEEEEEKDVELDYPFDDSIVIPSGGFEIPIISNLQNRFPFSIPWDITNLLKYLRKPSVAPHFEASWYIAPLHYTWEFSLDLSSFNSVAQIFRVCFLISFIIGLAIFSFNHFFGT